MEECKEIPGLYLSSEIGTPWAFDTEDDSRGNVYCINFYDGRDHFTFMDQRSALTWLFHNRGPIELWAVNLGYDLNNLFRDRFGLIEITYVGSRIISAKVVGTQIRFRDTLNHWKLSVRDMGERIGLPKIETKNRRDVMYCRRDTEITQRFVIQMRDNYEKMGCKLKTTIGSTALEFYYSKFGKRPTDSEIFSFNELEFMKRGYYGGRTEIFWSKPVSGRIWYFDINSLYPSVLRSELYPCLDSRKWVRSPNFENEGMAEVEIVSPRVSIPYLPYRRESKSLVFPIGVFKGVYTYFEIRKALECGYKLKKFIKGLEFDKVDRPFTQFVDHLYEKRLEAQKASDSLMSDSCKLLMNNLYGKFFQGNKITKLIPDKKGKYNGATVFGENVLYESIGNYPKHTNGIWACYCTAYARDRLYSALNRVERNGGLLMYCDTDSIIFESEQPILEDSKNLGEFKLEGEFRYGHFKLPKLYCLIPKQRGRKRIYRSKGVPRKYAAKFFTSGSARFRRPYKLREVLRRNLSPRRRHKLIPNYWEWTSKEIKQKYDKRQVFKNGRTKPIEL